MFVPARRDDPEMLDRVGNDPTDLEHALDDIARVNRLLRGSRILIEAVDPFLDWIAGDETLEILDVGTGGGDLLSDLAAHAAARGTRVRIVGTDLDPAIVAIARRRLEGRPEISIVEADARKLDYEDGSFDLVTLSMFLHHLGDHEGVLVLRRLRRIARKAVVVNDLRRHLVPWAFIAVAARLARCHPMFVHDAPLSVLKGFTPDEMTSAAQAAGASSARVVRRWPFRIVATIPASGRAAQPDSRDGLSLGLGA